MENNHRDPQDGRRTTSNRRRAGERAAQRRRRNWLIALIALIAIIVLIIIISTISNNKDAATQRYAEEAANNAYVKTEFQETMENATPNIIAATDIPTATPTGTPNATIASPFPQTIYDNRGLKISITGFDRFAVLGPEITYTIENNSGMDLIIELGELTCEGWTLTDYTSYDTVSDGSKTAGMIYIYNSYLDACGLSTEELKNVTFKNAEIMKADYSQSNTFEASATLMY